MHTAVQSVAAVHRARRSNNDRGSTLLPARILETIIASLEAIRERTLQLPVPGITRAAHPLLCVHIRSTGEKQKMSSRGQLNEFESS